MHGHSTAKKRLLQELELDEAVDMPVKYSRLSFRVESAPMAGPVGLVKTLNC